MKAGRGSLSVSSTIMLKLIQVGAAGCTAPTALGQRTDDDEY